ncbi:hypothetical protein [Brevibacterium sp.]|uniref:hypothetical protein n=1 Tax=Brevibacterium sp. TaxID=1701 RepID=UPI0028118C5C|nr:hypothetical protein [Brevibacterium sp.]
MDTLPNNLHAEIATGRLGETPAPGTAGSGISTQIHFAADAIAHALLALVYEQRTANEIAYMRWMTDHEALLRPTCTEDEVVSANRRIRARLGRTEES